MTNVVDPSNDNFPPGRVTDLSVFNLGNDLSLSFTSPGDDLDSVDHVAEYIIKYSSTAGNLSGSNFDNESFNNMIKEPSSETPSQSTVFSVLLLCPAAPAPPPARVPTRRGSWLV